MLIDEKPIVQPPAFFWFKTEVTFTSTLTPVDIRDRLEKLLPSFAVPPDRPGLFFGVVDSI